MEIKLLMSVWQVSSMEILIIFDELFAEAKLFSVKRGNDREIERKQQQKTTVSNGDFIEKTY